MQQVTFNINEEADLPFLKKLLESLKGVSNFKVENKAAKEMSDEEYDEKFDDLLNKSLQQSIEGRVTPYNSEEMRRKFKARIKNAG